MQWRRGSGAASRKMLYCNHPFLARMQDRADGKTTYFNGLVFRRHRGGRDGKPKQIARGYLFSPPSTTSRKGLREGFPSQRKAFCWPGR